MKRLPYKKVTRLLKQGYSIKKIRSEKWTLQLVEYVNKQVGDEWYALTLESEYWMYQLCLPWHRHEAWELVPAVGATPAATAEKAKNRAVEFQKKSPKCAHNIQCLRHVEPLPILLTTTDLRHYEISFEQLIVGPQQMIVLDGLHRVVAKALNSLETGRLYPVSAIVAGSQESIVQKLQASGMCQTVIFV